MNINLHIDSIVLDGLDFGSGKSQLLQQAVASQLTEMLTQRSIGSQFDNSGEHNMDRGNSIPIGQTMDAMTLGPQLASAIYSAIPRSQLGLEAANGGKS